MSEQDQFIEQNGDASAVAAGAALDEQRALVVSDHGERIASLEVALSASHNRFVTLELALARIVNHLDPHGTSASVRGAEDAANA